MKKPDFHIFVCNSFRMNGTPKGTCNRKGDGLIQYLEEEILDRGIDALITSTGCMKECEKGPLMVVQPNNVWYGNVNEELIDTILDSIEDGELTEEGRL